MWQTLGAATDFVHALVMAIWLLALPLLFVSRWPRLRRAYAAFAVGFIVLSQGSQALLGECFFTTIARWFWEHPSARGAAPAHTEEWFTVRMARAVFDLSPTHREITLASEALMLVTAIGVLWSIHHGRRSRRRSANARPESLGPMDARLHEGSP